MPNALGAVQTNLKNSVVRPRFRPGIKYMTLMAIMYVCMLLLDNRLVKLIISVYLNVTGNSLIF